MNRYLIWAETTGVKALKTAAQSLVALIGAASVNVVALPWGDYLGIAAAAGVVCVLHNITALPDPTVSESAPVLVPIEADPVSSSPSDPAPAPTPAPLDPAPVPAPVEPAPTA